MKFVLFGRLKKQAPEGEAQKPKPAASKKLSAEERVAFLVSQGLAEPEIIKVLKDEGYSFQEIDSSISNVLKSRVSDQPLTPTENDGANVPDDLAPLMNSEDTMQNTPQQLQAELTEQMDAVMEQMMEEKFSGIESELDKIDKKFEELENKIRQVSTRIVEDETVEKRTEEKSEGEIADVNTKETNLEPGLRALKKRSRT